MRICIDLTPAVQNHGGMGRYAEELTRALLALDAGDDIRVFYADAQGRAPSPPLDALPHRSIRWRNKAWRMSVLLASHLGVPLNALVGDAEVFHATDHLLPPVRGARSVFTLHDLVFLSHPEVHLPLNTWFLRTMLPVFVRRADAVICVSEHTRQDALRFYGLEESKIWVIPEGVDSRFRPVRESARLASVRARYGLPERFILFVGTIEPRKNLVTLLESQRILLSEGHTEKLVVVGRRGWRWQPTFARLRELGLEDQVIFPGYVRDEDLPVLYSLATCFAFPSLYEGFGLPPLEAMACGCPVVCSETSSLPEVCGDAALLVPPTEVPALTSAIRRVLDNPALRDDLRTRGREQASRFTWQEAARRTREVYRGVFSGSD